jgi:hypothetical protein
MTDETFALCAGGAFVLFTTCGIALASALVAEGIIRISPPESGENDKHSMAGAADLKAASGANFRGLAATGSDLGNAQRACLNSKYTKAPAPIAGSPDPGHSPTRYAG